MIYRGVSSDWWKALIEHFVKAGDSVEIRCWKEEADEIACAERYGKATNAGNEVSVTAVVTDTLIKELMLEERHYEDLYNK